MARPSRYVTELIQRQFDCEQVGEECCCGCNGDHSELHRLMEEEPQHFFDFFIG